MVRKILPWLIIFHIFAFPLFAEKSLTRDYSTWNFKRDGVLELTGEWEFFPDEYIEPGSQLSSPVSLWVIGGWNKVMKRWGYGTYRLKLILPESDEPLALYLGNVSSSYRLYVNGEMLKEVGIPGLDRKTNRPDGYWDFLGIPRLSGETEIIIQVANFHEVKGGLLSKPRLGTRDQLRTQQQISIIINTTIFGVFFSLGLYHLLLYLIRKTEETALFFGLFSLILGFRIIQVQFSLFSLIFHGLNGISWVWAKKMEYISFFLLVVIFPGYFHRLFKEYVNVKLGKSLIFLSLAYILLTLISPLWIYSMILTYYQVIIVLWILYALGLLIKLTRKNIWEGKVLLVGFLVFFICIILDFLAPNYNSPLAQFGFFAFLMAQSSLLIKRFSDSYERVENLTESLNHLLDERQKYQQVLERRVTERTADLALAVDEAKAANLAKGDFLARMSHEIRTPMNGVLGFAEIIRECDNMEEAKDYANNIIGESEKLMILINQLLDLSRIDAGALQLDNGPFALSGLFDSLMPVFNSLSEAKGIRFHLLCDSQDVEASLLGDSFRLRQILLNLVGNAIKFTDQGKVELIIEKNKETDTSMGFLFVIHDTGKGIAEDKLEGIFDSFVQEDTSITREFGGSGLGTAISRSFVELMNGEIGVESVPAMGTSFWFSLEFPLVENYDAGEKNLSPKPDEIVFHGEKVLLAEDYMANQEVVKNFLKHYDLELAVAVDGAQACEMLKKKQYDLILLDIHMPKMNGYAVAEFIRNGLKSDMKIIGLTADGYQQVMERCMDAGMDDFLTKPIRKGKLIETLTKWLIP